MENHTEKEQTKHRAMMNEGEPLPVEIVLLRGGQREPGMMRLWRLDDEARTKRGLSFMFRAWLLGALAIVCPPHFPWPIVGFITGIVGYLVRSRQAQRLLGGEGKCPKCGAEQWMESGPVEFPFSHFCSTCRTRCNVERSAPPVAPS